jgi:hypothetical protein
MRPIVFLNTYSALHDVLTPTDTSDYSIIYIKIPITSIDKEKTSHYFNGK